MAFDPGQIIVGGFNGDSTKVERALRTGELGGVILFKRNLTNDPLDTARWIERVLGGCAGPLPIVAVDQEGGRVARFGPPLLKLPPALTLASLGDPGFVEHAAFLQGEELAALGFSTSFAPVLDVHTFADNPVIGDRSFGRDAESAAIYALAFARGLRRAGLFSCGKHYPGHGRTTKDSHFELPVVHAREAELLATEFEPFRKAAQAGVESFMTAHVLYPSIDSRPATLSSKISTKILRDDLGFRGVLFSDDLEMKALSAPIEELSVEAVLAGCDALLICSSEELQGRAREALAKELASSTSFRDRFAEAKNRFDSLRSKMPPRPSPAMAADLFGRQERLDFERTLLDRIEAVQERAESPR